jgi:hypothetical protein
VLRLGRMVANYHAADSSGEQVVAAMTGAFDTGQIEQVMSESGPVDLALPVDSLPATGADEPAGPTAGGAS